jgi:hypothetical protein
MMPSAESTLVADAAQRSLSIAGVRRRALWHPPPRPSVLAVSTAFITHPSDACPSDDLRRNVERADDCCYRSKIFVS